MVDQFSDLETPDFHLKLTMKLQDEIEGLRAEIARLKRERIKVYDSYEDLRIQAARDANQSVWAKSRQERETLSKIESREIKTVEDLWHDSNT